MKRITLLFIGLWLSLSTYGQKATSILSEDFSSGVPPTGWTIDNLSAQWDQSATGNAGGTSPEARLTWLQQTNSTRMISPETDLSGFSSVIFSFKHFLNDYSGTGYTIGVATRSGGGSWNDVWTVNPTGDMGPETVNVLISNADVGTSDFQVCIYLDGNMYNFDYWFIDNVSLIAPDTNDSALDSIDNLPYNAPGDVEIMCTVKNLGFNNITSIDVNYQIDSGTIETENLTGLDLATTESFNHTFSTPWAATAGAYSLKVWVSNMNGAGNDDDVSNDMLTQAISAATQTTQNNPLFEEFTSATCGPCEWFNSTHFNSFITANESNLSLIKYQMNWPGSGDIYYTAEGGVRRDYYGVSGVPTTYIDGNDPDFFSNPTLLQPEFDAALLKPAFFSLIANFEIDGDNITVEAVTTPYVEGNFSLQIVVVEKITTGNVSTNGETQFEHVMMKMLPDASGTEMNFILNTPETVNYSYDMSTTNVEEMSDLAVVVFIQDNNTQEVLQSVTATEGGIGVDESAFQSVSVYPNPTVNSLNIKNAEGLILSMYDVLGRELFVKQISSSKAQINVANFSEGTYIVKLTDGVKVKTEKIVIAR